mmetsp:Transcript_71134/g.203916  ORF Transcript_71134/g.203916 Transcript_71134/m.203916 type:complete len:922 (+) Transcript_71134:181-2946(+)
MSSTAPQYLGSAPPAPLRTWRCKVGPRRLAEIDAPVSVAGSLNGTARGSGALASPTPPPPSVDGARSKTVRLSRLNPGLMRRLEDVRLPEDDAGHHPWGRAQPSATVSGGSGRNSPAVLVAGGARVAHSGALEVSPFIPRGLPMADIVDVPRSKWSMSLPPARRPSLTRRRAGSGVNIEASERDRVLGSYGLLASQAPVADSPDSGAYDVGRETPNEDRDGLVREVEALRRHRTGLEEAPRQHRAARAGDCGSTDVAGFQDEILRLREELRSAQEDAVACSLRQAGLLEEERRTCASELATQRANAEARVAAAECESEKRAAAAEQRLEALEAKHAEAEERHREAVEAASRQARLIRARTSAAGTMFVADCSRGMTLAVFSSWKTQVCESNLLAQVQAQTELRAEAEASEAAAESGRRLAVRRAGLAEATAADEASRLRARSTAAEARLSCAEALHEAAAEEAERLRKKAEERAQEMERRTSAIAAEQEARHRGELANSIAAKQLEFEHALVEQATSAELRLKEEIDRNRLELHKLASEIAEKLWRDRSAKECSACAHRAATSGSDKAAPRSRALRGASKLVDMQVKAGLGSLFAGWRTAVRSQKATSALQAKLFQEQSGRAAALRGQKLELDTRYMEAEARHRAALRRLRAELAEAETRHADALASQEAEAAQRLASAEVDFSQVLRSAAGASCDTGSTTAEEAEYGCGTTPRSPTAAATVSSAACADLDDEAVSPTSAVCEDVGVDMCIGAETDEDDDEDCADSDSAIGGQSRLRRRGNRRAASPIEALESSIGGVAAAVAETRLTEVLRALRTRSEARLADAEARHTEAILAERERSDMRFAREERRHEEALRVARESAERRIAAAEARHVEALRAGQDAAEVRLLQAEAMISQLKSLLQASGVGGADAVGLPPSSAF